MLKACQRPRIPIQDLLNPAYGPEVQNEMEKNPQETQKNWVKHVKDHHSSRFDKSKQPQYNGILAKGGVRSVNITDVSDSAILLATNTYCALRDSAQMLIASRLAGYFRVTTITIVTTLQTIPSC